MISYNRIEERIYLNFANTDRKKEKGRCVEPPYSGKLCQRNLFWNLSVTTPALSKCSG